MAQDLALEAAILADRDDPAPYLVYADWLEARGDPRGELIALQYRADRIEPENGELLMVRDEHLRRHPALVPAIDIWQARLHWRWGFIERASIEDLLASDLLVLLEHPSCSLLRTLEIVARDAEAPALARALLGAVRPSLEQVSFEQDCEPGRSATAPEAGPWSRLPGLRRLSVAGRSLFQPIDHPALESLELRGDPIGREAPWNLPALTRLSWRTLGGSLVHHLTELEPLWSAHLPTLRRLELGSFWARPNGEPGLLEHEWFLRLLPHLEALRVPLYAIRSDALQAFERLLEQRGPLAHLQKLVVQMDYELAEMVEALEAFLATREFARLLQRRGQLPEDEVPQVDLDLPAARELHSRWIHLKTVLPNLRCSTR